MWYHISKRQNSNSMDLCMRVCVSHCVIFNPYRTSGCLSSVYVSCSQTKVKNPDEDDTKMHLCAKTVCWLLEMNSGGGRNTKQIGLKGEEGQKSWALDAQQLCIEKKKKKKIRIANGGGERREWWWRERDVGGTLIGWKGKKQKTKKQHIRWSAFEMGWRRKCLVFFFLFFRSRRWFIFGLIVCYFAFIALSEIELLNQ